MKKQTNKKKHHYVPVSYLKAFCGKDGELVVYRKDAPTEPFRSRPGEVAFHKYYYAQPLPDGGRDTNRLEDRFSALEGKWPPIVDALAARDMVNDRLGDIFTFVALQRARVPAARDAAEQMLAATVLATARQLEAEGKLRTDRIFKDVVCGGGVSSAPVLCERRTMSPFYAEGRRMGPSPSETVRSKRVESGLLNRRGGKPQPAFLPGLGLSALRASLAGPVFEPYFA